MTTDKKLKIGSRVKVTNMHQEDCEITNKMGVGYIRSFYIDCKEERAEIFFPRSKISGGWPLNMVRAA